MTIDFFSSENIYSFSVSEALVSSIDDRDREHVKLLTLTNLLASDLETRPAFLAGSIDPSSTFHPFEYRSHRLRSDSLSTLEPPHESFLSALVESRTLRKYLARLRAALLNASLFLLHYFF